MKKLFLLVLTIVAFSAASYAQGVSFGIKAGVNFANQKYEVDGFSFSPDARTGFHVGGFVTAMFSESLGLQPELIFNSVGAKMDDSSLNMSYLSVPVLIRYQPIELLNIHVGPQFGFLMGAESEGDDVKDAFKGLDLGAAFGAGIDLPAGIGFTARYVLGLSNIYDESDEGTIKNNVFQISLSYRFGGN